MPKKDLRFELIKIMIETERIKTFPQIFRYMPRHTMAKYLHIGPKRLKIRVSDTSTYTFGELSLPAELIGVNNIIILNMIANQFLEMTGDIA